MRAVRQKEGKHVRLGIRVMAHTLGKNPELNSG